MQNGNIFKKILNFLSITEHPAKKQIDRKLIFRIRIFYVIGIVLTGLMLYDVLEGIVGIELALGGFLAGLFLGFLAYSILAGIMIGRIVGMRLKIRNILSEQFIY